MARFFGSARYRGYIPPQSLRTVVQLLAPANQRVAVVGYAMGAEHSIFLENPSTKAPTVVDLLRQTTVGGMAGLTANKFDSSLTETLRTLGFHGGAGGEPAAGDLLRTFTVNLQGSVHVREAQDDEIIIGGGGRLGCRVYLSTAVNYCSAVLEFEE